jgi:hypothetical protein
MNKVWIVAKTYWEDTTIIKVFDSREKAERFKSDITYGHDEYAEDEPNYYVYEYEVE